MTMNSQTTIDGEIGLRLPAAGKPPLPTVAKLFQHPHVVNAMA